MTLVFVYGTLKGLKTRFGHGSPFQESEFVGHATTVDDFNLVDGVYPIALLSDDVLSKHQFNGKILGEVYAVGPDCVAALDQYEDYPDLYTRHDTKVKLIKGGTVRAWIYTGRNARAMVGKQGRDYIVPNASGELYWHFDSEIPLTDQTM